MIPDPVVAQGGQVYYPTQSTISIESLLNPVVEEEGPPPPTKNSAANGKKSFWSDQMKRMEKEFPPHQQPWKAFKYRLQPKSTCWLMHILLAHRSGKVRAVFSHNGFAGVISSFRVPAQHVDWWNAGLFPSIISMDSRSPAAHTAYTTIWTTGFKEMFESHTGDLVYIYNNELYLQAKYSMRKHADDNGRK
jgi:hypothetical protein